MTGTQSKRKKRKYELPISKRYAPDEAFPWLYAADFLREAGASSARTEKTYTTALRLLADWVQHHRRGDYTVKQKWPLDPAGLTTEMVVGFNGWLMVKRSMRTARTYIAGILGYLNHLDARDLLPAGIQLGKLNHHLKRSQKTPNQASEVVELDQARRDMPLIVDYYRKLPLPPENDSYNRRLSLLRDRALVAVMYATAMRVSEVVNIRRSQVAGSRKTFVISGKGESTRTIHLRDEYAQQAISAYLAERTDEGPYLFVAHSRRANGARLSTVSAEKVVKKAVKALGLDPRLSAHDFRHYKATELLREDVPLAVVQEYLGHRDVSTTRAVYAPVLGEERVGEWLDNVDQGVLKAAAERQKERDDQGR